MPIQDTYGRSFRSLRLSLTDSCNFQCLYCAPAKKETVSSKKEWPKASQYVEYVKRIHAVNPLESVRLTGGEPSLYPFLPELISLLKALGIRRVSMTSNAFRLGKAIPALSEAGLDSLNISLDSLRPEMIRRMSRHPHAEEVLEDIETLLALHKAEKLGKREELSKREKKQKQFYKERRRGKKKIEIKINCTLWRGINHTEVVSMLAYFGKRGVPLRYLELMNMGHLYRNFKNYLYTQEEILRDLSLHYSFQALKRDPSATARYWETKEKWVFGIIANHSAPFCGDCDRLRMDSQGRLYGCLSSTQSFPFPVSGPREQTLLKDSLKAALAQKQPLSFQGSQLSMQAIGG